MLGGHPAGRAGKALRGHSVSETADPARELRLPSVGRTGQWWADESFVDRRRHVSALWDLGHITLPGVQSLVISPHLASSPSCPFILPVNLPCSKRGSPPACGLTGTKGQKGMEPRVVQPDSPQEGCSRDSKALELPPEPSFAAPGTTGTWLGF